MAAFDPSERDFLESTGANVGRLPFERRFGYDIDVLERYRQDIAALAQFRRENSAWRNNSRGFMSTPLGWLAAAAIPFAAPAVGGLLGLSGLAGAAAGGAALGGGLSAVAGEDVLEGALTGALGSGLGSLSSAHGLMSGLPRGASDALYSFADDLSSAAMLASAQARPDYDPDRPEPEEPPPLDVIIGPPPAPPIDIPPPVSGGGGGGGGGGAPSPTVPGDVSGGRGDGGAAEDPDYNPPLYDDPFWQYIGQGPDGWDIYYNRETGQVEEVPRPGGQQGGTGGTGGTPGQPDNGVDVDIIPDVGGGGDADLGAGGSSGDQDVGEGAGSGSGTGGTGDGAGGDGSGSGDAVGFGDLLGLLGVVGATPGQFTAQSPEVADVNLYDLDNFFGSSRARDVYNLQENELTSLIEDLLQAARRRG